MPLTTGLQTTVDAKLDDLVTQLATIQGTYKTTNGKYWQGRACTATVPADGATVASTPTDVPTDQTRIQVEGIWYGGSWADVGITLDASLPVCLHVDAYDGPQGHGYVVNGMVTEGASTYQRSINVGPETYRTQAWTDITPE